MRTTLLLIAMTTLAASGSIQDRAESERQVRQATEQFLRTFEDLDMQRFIQCFSEDATVFFPIPEPPTRFDGIQAIQRHFEQVFAAIRQSSASSTPPFHHLVPEHLHVQVVSDTTAVVTFQLTNPERVARRTLVLQKRGDRWLIVHLHASNVALERHSSNQSMEPTAPLQNDFIVFAIAPCCGSSPSN
jgi:uncharacterized protein (TIGR02246 family)